MASFLTTGLILSVQQLWGFQSLELLTFDQLIRLQSRSVVDPRLLVVEITESDLVIQKEWPISDATLARSLELLQNYQPAVIGLDLYRNLEHPPGAAALQAQLEASNVMVITKLPDERTSGVPAPDGIPEERIGFNDFVIDPDGVIRRNFLYAYLSDDQQFYSFALRLALTYFKAHGYSFDLTPRSLQVDGISFTPLQPHAGGYEAIDAVGLQTLIDYRVKEVAERISLSDVLSGKIDADLVRDRIVLIGLTGISIQDNFLTPHSAQAQGDPHWPGVLIHAQLTHQILSTVIEDKPLIWFWSKRGEILWIWFWTLIGGALVWRIHTPLKLWLAGIGAWGALIAFCWASLTLSGWIPLVAPSLALFVTIASLLAYKSLYVSFYDSLTGLPNRTQFLQLLQTRTNDAHSKFAKDFALLFLGLERFNVVNDTLGYRAGDRLLLVVRDRLKQCLNHQGIVGRVGVDEFAILVNGLHTSQEMGNLTKQMQQSIKQPVVLSDREVSISSSVGIAFGQANYSYQPEDLLRNAHTAMYRAKALGTACYEVFAIGMQNQMARRLEIETDLRQALQRQELMVHYQPIVDLETGDLAGFEALARWYHPQQGFVSPAEFVGIAEETDLIIPLGQWVLEEACRQLQQWQTEFRTQRSGQLPLMMNVNLSSKQFSDIDLVQSVKETLDRTALDPHCLKLEITESMAMDNVESSIDILLGLKNLNLQLSIDDFGIGYSCLSYLCSFPVDTLKVDRSFVSRMETSDADRAIVQTIITLSHALGMNVTAEGIETAEQREMLENFKCEYGQGYFFSKPLNAEHATELLCQVKRW